MAGSFQRGSLRIGLLSKSPEVRSVLKRIATDLENLGFMQAYAGSPMYLADDPEKLEVRYGGAWETDVNDAVCKVLKAFNKASAPVEMDKRWHDRDIDVNIIVPSSWLAIKKEWLWYDPVLCCHMSDTEEAFKNRQTLLAKQGYQIKTGVRGR